MNKPALLLRQTRENLVETEFYGYIVFSDENKQIFAYGDAGDYPFFHRSCAKPLQAAFADELGVFEYFEMPEEEISVCCGSHTGEKLHIDILKGLLEKGGLSENDLKCPIIPPLNNFDGITEFSPLHNNCSGKHTLMLLTCRKMGWKIENYLDFEHPLQAGMYEKIKSLCEITTELPKTLDGCTAPNFATPILALNRAFLNLHRFHPSITSAMMAHPYICGGKNRLDTHLMQISPYICAKVGAGGLCTVLNTKISQVFTIKIIDANMKARTLIALEILRQKKWIDESSIDKNLLNEFFNYGVYTETGVRTGKYEPQFNFSAHI